MVPSRCMDSAEMVSERHWSGERPAPKLVRYSSKHLRQAVGKIHTTNKTRKESGRQLGCSRRRSRHSSTLLGRYSAILGRAEWIRHWRKYSHVPKPTDVAAANSRLLGLDCRASQYHGRFRTGCNECGGRLRRKCERSHRSLRMGRQSYYTCSLRRWALGILKGLYIGRQLHTLERSQDGVHGVFERCTRLGKKPRRDS